MEKNFIDLRIGKYDPLFTVETFFVADFYKCYQDSENIKTIMEY